MKRLIKNITSIIIINCFIITSLGIAGCKKLIDIPAPNSSLNGANVYATDATASAVLTGIYTTLSYQNSVGFATEGFTSLSLFPSLSADELSLYDVTNPNYSGYYLNALASTSVVGTADYWKTIYQFVYLANDAVEGVGSSTTLTPAVKQQLLGEALFVRAFCYFYLVNLYGDVPLALSTDWEINAALSRSPKEQVYAQIIADLQQAEEFLSANYLQADVLLTSPERVRPTKWAAAALLARVYLYQGKWAEAEEQSSLVINNSSLFALTALNDVFLKNSNETIWQLQAVGTGTDANTGEGKLFILPETGPGGIYPVYLDSAFVNSFEFGDQRAVNWVGNVPPTPPGTITYYYPFKYKIGAVETSAEEYCMVLRLAEQYLIRAEARAQQNNIGGAQEDINIIRTRSGLGNTPASDHDALLAAIMQERRFELFTEWGHRWFDLKRMGMIDSVMETKTALKGGEWNTTDQLYPIPLDQLEKAPQLTQNAGY
jgi:hypothetical protein